MISRKTIVCLFDLLLVFCTLVGLTGCSTKPVEDIPEKEIESVSETNTEVRLEESIEVYSVCDAYDAKEIKHLFLLGNSLPDSLCIMDEDKHKVMSIPVIPYGTINEKILGVVDFSSLKQTGKYIVFNEENYQDQMGSFSIKNGKFTDEIKNLVGESSKNPTDYEKLVLYESYRLFPEVFEDNWGALEGSKPSLDDDNISINAIEDFWNCIEYINSSEKIDLDIAAEMMTEIIRNSEVILAKYKDQYPFFAVPQDKQAIILEDMARLAVIDKILPAYEYYKVIDKEISFLRGLNSENLAINLDNPQNRAHMILVLSHLATKEESINELYAQEN